MGKKQRILFVNQEIGPYVVGTPMSVLGSKLPQVAQEQGYETRIFMPKFGVISERRNQLHDVLRLSGLNIMVAGGDHPLNIKVASLSSLRLQVYFIDNEDFFMRRGITHDPLGEPYSDNDARALFFARGVLETVKKLRWIPDIIHCSGWFSSFVPLLLRRNHANDPALNRAKILFSLYEDDGAEMAGENSEKTLQGLKVSEEDAQDIRESTHASLCRMAMRNSDAGSYCENNVVQEILQYAESIGRKIYDLRVLDDINGVYDEISKMAAVVR